ncbi:MAG TPA: hypothetical protein PLW86_14355, partial [Rhodocyclaceae bacterium]|nr:hypothetical protein [Rhodocyclaceae bacterium]
AHLANMAGHAAVGCAMAAAQGGNCEQGAKSAAVGSFVTPLAAGAGPVGGLVITTIAGGTASVLGGGKFANGAVTAAAGYLFNQLSPKQPVQLRVGNEVHDGFVEVLRQEFGAQNVRAECSVSGGRCDAVLFGKYVLELKSATYQLSVDPSKYADAVSKLNNVYVPGIGANARPGDFRDFFPKGQVDLMLDTSRGTSHVRFFADPAGKNTGMVFYRLQTPSSTEH